MFRRRNIFLSAVNVCAVVYSVIYYNSLRRRSFLTRTAILYPEQSFGYTYEKMLMMYHFWFMGCVDVNGWLQWIIHWSDLEQNNFWQSLYLEKFQLSSNTVPIFGTFGFLTDTHWQLYSNILLKIVGKNWQ